MVASHMCNCVDKKSCSANTYIHIARRKTVCLNFHSGHDTVQNGMEMWGEIVDGDLEMKHSFTATQNIQTRLIYK